jgi:hypothetical protein
VNDKQDIVEQLRLWSEQLKSLSRWTSGKLKFPQRITLIGEAADEIEQLRKERDEARRSCCEYAAIVDGADTTKGMESGRFYKIAMNYMKDRGWDCFKENGK